MCVCVKGGGGECKRSRGQCGGRGRGGRGAAGGLLYNILHQTTHLTCTRTCTSHAPDHTPPPPPPLPLTVPLPPRAEDAFFDGRTEYAEVRSSCGVGNLAMRLNTILVAHIRSLLPSLRRHIGEALEARTNELRSYGEALAPESKAAK